MRHSHFIHVFQPSTYTIENFDTLFLFKPSTSNLIFKRATLADFHDDIDVLVSAEHILLAY